MKKITLIIISLMMMSAIHSFASVKKEINNLQKVSLTPSVISLSENGGMVNVSFTVNVPKNYVKKCMQYVLTPVLSDYKNVEKLPSVVITGRKFSKYLKRRGMSTMEYPFMKNGYILPVTGEAEVINYNYNVKFEPWMTDANLIMDQRFITKRRMSEIASDVYAKGVSYTPPVVEEVVVVKPQIITVIVNNKEGILDLNFPISSSKIDMKLGDNIRELAMLKEKINMITGNQYNVIDSIRITASSSPDGVYAKNEALTKERAQAVKEYIIKEYGSKFPSTDRIITCNITENWDLMKILVKMSPQTNVKAVLDLFDIQDQNQRSNAMLKLPQFNYIKKYILPELRYVKYEIFYTNSMMEVVE